MTAQAIDQATAPNPALRIPIKEDSSFHLGMSRIPFAGVVISWAQQNSIMKQIHESHKAIDPSRIIELVKVKNLYHVADMDRDLLTGALLVGGVALGIIHRTWGYVAVGTTLLSAAGDVYQIYNNNQVIKQLQEAKRRLRL